MSEENRLMGKGELRGWIDTEGSIGISKPAEPFIEVGQEFREPLEVFCRSVDERYPRARGKCVIVRAGKKAHQARIRGLEAIAEVGKDLEPFRNAKRREQWENFKQFVKKPRKRLTKEVKEARRILGLLD